jgi:hypothetical protein
MSGATGGGGLDIPGWLNSMFGRKNNNQDQSGGYVGTGNPAPAQYTTPAYMSGATGGGNADIGSSSADSGANALKALSGGFNQSSYGTPTSIADPTNTGTTGADPLGQQQGQQNPMIAGIIAAMNSQSPYDSGPYMQNLDAARASSLKAIAGAEDRTNANFNTSNQAIGNIYAKGKQDTLADNNVLKSNNANLVGGLNSMYAGATKGLQDDRHKEMADQVAMDQALGIQQAGLGDAGKTQTQAIVNASQAQQASVDKALQYGGADLTENTARADGLITEGASRQAALRSQLAGVLGQLDSKKIDVDNTYQNNAMQARNQSYQDNLSKMSALYGMYDKELTRSDNRYKTDQNSRTQAALITAEGKLAANGGSGSGGQTNIQDANSFVQSQGGNPADYNNAYSGAIMDAGTPAGMQPTETDLLKGMMAKNPHLDLTQAIQYIRNASNASKYNSPNNSGIAMLANQVMAGQ